ncbi:beta-N-acetylhexosaminidase [Longitalea luteola]|uniref:beta-N-acetylhexosaminidase n=1 Tax=Longitalea luteola TaxID=2812563 RepID=UPI001A970BD6|nr:beta-N-acetylhexosaminidase [Longitalea luteola]
MKTFILFLLLTAACIPVISQQPDFIIPLPDKFTKQDGSFSLDQYTPIVIRESAFRDQANFLQQELLKRNGLTLAVQSQSTVPSIVIDRLPGADNVKGEYKLSITPKEISISARSQEGIFYGVTSLVQLIQQSISKNATALIPCWDIEDKPAFAWRGILLDESRYFFGKETVKFILDWMAFYKLNRFHWHLTDDPGWRLEIKKYPKLGLVGGVGNYFDTLAAAKYYTQEEIKEIIAYAQQRFIEVIPEIDMPGHARGANKAYPQFSGGGSKQYPEFTFNPGREETYKYLTDILKETNALFPSEMIHLGGDEVHFGNEQWNTNKDVQQLMKDKKLANLKAVETYFIERMADSVVRMNNKALFWDEVAGSSFDPANSIIFWWRHDRAEQLKLALSKGFTVVLTPRIPLYFDFVQDTMQRVGRRWKPDGSYSSLQLVYDFSPSRLYDAKHAPLVLGMQGSIWTERISTTDKLEYMMFPRIAGLAEASWTAENKRKDFAGFSRRIEKHLELYRKHRLYFYNPFSPQENPEPIVPGFINR